MHNLVSDWNSCQHVKYCCSERLKTTSMNSDSCHVDAIPGSGGIPLNHIAPEMVLRGAFFFYTPMDRVWFFQFLVFPKLANFFQSLPGN